jgi:tRNA A-37 threonylcarbamoyl transferase component Bud32
MQICPLSEQEFAQLTAGAEVIESDGHSLKVLRLGDGRYLKYFRRKHLISRDLMVAAAVRFARHSRRLVRMQIPTLTVLGLHRIRGSADTIAIYQPLPGQPLRALLSGNQASVQLMYRVGAFIAQLHERGIYFRSLHPGNIIIAIAGSRLGLIDLLDMRFKGRPLSRWQRHRNWLHFLRTRIDWPHLSRQLIDAVLAGYRDASRLPAKDLQRIADHAERVHASASR